MPPEKRGVVGRGASALAFVLGNLDLVRPLGLAGIRCISVAPARHPVHFSRFVVGHLPSDAPDLVERFVELASRLPEKPVLLYESDEDLELIVRHRDLVESSFRVLLPPAELLAQLLDKELFLELAERLELPVPRSQVLSPRVADEPPGEIAPDFPVVLKPLPHRDPEWYHHVSSGKALRVGSSAELRELWPRLRSTRLRFLAQELVEGPETRVLSYHVYVDGEGRRAGDFTGRKIRTYPTEFGRSTALETIADAKLLATGRSIVERLELRGVAKLDFKCDAAGRLFLLEVNPRYSLWAHLGALAGVNLPALAYADLTGLERPPAALARPGVRWTWPRPDAEAARECGVPLRSWIGSTLRSEAKTNLSWDDPMPFLRGWMLPNLASGARRALGRR
jgi:predicted ATP-grasp superfamily ATP-dependent carboligase